MAVGKNKCLTKGSKKGAKKRADEPLSKKVWYDVKTPAMFTIKNIEKTLVTVTQGTKITSDDLKDCVFEVSLADLHNDGVAFRKFKANDLKEVFNKWIPDSTGKDTDKVCQSISPLRNVFVRKVKTLKKRKSEQGELMELHGEGSSSGKATGDETGAKAEQADAYEPPVQESVKNSDFSW
ncbi:hypothetical protein mRhiFer1_009970 [Rhinolophus ferrumequinum]|uniref:40S ribosomal protein S3a n=1 Tax=Rhinolophus ferrumequinum TaxID=59479 RepID=A0A7J7YIP8_RHIFE|nr:hypothetical protein mRhiFer1_009970 [Rhinolophus ferrumequinum]